MPFIVIYISEQFLIEPQETVNPSDQPSIGFKEKLEDKNVIVFFN